MNEKVFQSELAETFRKEGAWAKKWPDQPVSFMRDNGAGKLRFAVPKPYDIQLCLPDGRFGCIECKMVKGPSFLVDDHVQEQLKTLLDIVKRNGYAALAVNFRFARKTSGRTNRAFIVDQPCWLDGMMLQPHRHSMTEFLITGRELQRIAGGWSGAVSVA